MAENSAKIIGQIDTSQIQAAINKGQYKLTISQVKVPTVKVDVDTSGTKKVASAFNEIKNTIDIFQKSLLSVGRDKLQQFSLSEYAHEAFTNGNMNETVLTPAA